MKKSLSLPAEVFRFRSVPFREIYPTQRVRVMEVRRGKLDPKKRLYNTQRDLYYWHVVLLAIYENCNKINRAISDLAAKISSNSPADHIRGDMVNRVLRHSVTIRAIISS